MGTTLSGKKPGGTDATFKWLLHTASATLEDPRRVTTGNGLETALVIGTDTLGLVSADGHTATLDAAELTADRSYSLPDHSGMLVVTGFGGTLVAENGHVMARDPSPPSSIWSVDLNASGGVLAISFNRGLTSGIIITAALTANRVWTLPDVEGVLPVVASYANQTAANAAVAVGDAWWDTTLKKLRVRLS